MNLRRCVACTFLLVSVFLFLSDMTIKRRVYTADQKSRRATLRSARTAQKRAAAEREQVKARNEKHNASNRKSRAKKAENSVRNGAKKT